MPETDLIWMSLVVFLPSLFALALVLPIFPRGWETAMCWWSLAGTALTLGVSIGMFFHFKADTVDLHGVTKDAETRRLASLEGRAAEPEEDRGKAAAREGSAADGAARRSKDWVTRYPWIERFNIEYFLGVDGISMPLVLLTTLICFLAMLASFNIKRYDSAERFVRGYCVLFLVLETGILGTFLALDFFLFYIFWEVMLLPMYFLIGVWGGPRREYAAIKFFLYTLLGSVFILIALLGFYFTNVRDFVSPQRAAAARSDLPALRDANDRYTLAVNATKASREGLAGVENELSGDLKPQQLQATRRKLGRLTKAYAEAKAAERRALAAVDKAKDQVEVNTFDLLVLAKAGRAALQHLKGQEPTDVPAVVAAEAEVPRAQERLNDARREVVEAKRLADKAEEGRVRALAEVRLAYRRQDVADAQAQLERSQANAAAAKAGLAERLNQPFFTKPFQYTMFLFLFIGFAIKVPVFPFHTWLPDAHVEAPTPISMILAGILLKLGGYGILRIAYPICPWAAESLATVLALFGVINIVYGAFAAMAQTDFKKLVAYSSVSHMGYVILGIAVWSAAETRQYWAWGMNGAMYQMIAHGVSSAGMFFLVGVIYDRAHHRNLDNFRGLYEPMPLYGGISAVIFFAAMGLPGLCGFVGEFFVVVGTWNFAPDGQRWIGITFAVLAALTVVLTAAYILWTLQRVFMGQNPAYKNYPDITVTELCCIVPLVVLAVVLGVLPGLVLGWMEPSVTHLVDTLASLK